MRLNLTNALLSSLPLALPSSHALFASSKFKFTFTLGICIRVRALNTFSSLQTTRHDDHDDLFAPIPSPRHVDKASNAIERIALRLRNLGLASADHADDDDFLRREWLRPDEALLPWDKREGEEYEEHEERQKEKPKKKSVNAATLAEKTLEEEELRRLRTLGMSLKEKVTIPKAGLTRAVLDKIHRQWSNCELVRLKFHEFLAQNMKLAHQIVEVCPSPYNPYFVLITNVHVFE